MSTTNNKYVPMDPMEGLQSFSYDGEVEKEDRSLDIYFSDIYNYFYYKGYYNTVITESFNLLNMFFMLLIFIFLTSAVDYDELFTSYNLHKATIHPKVSPIVGIFIAIYSVYWVYQFFVFIRIANKMRRIRDFYINTLGVDDQAIYTCKWNEIMEKLLPHTNDMDEHDIVNFIMRKKNFVIGLVNKDILTFNVNIPLVGKTSLLTRQLESDFKDIIFPVIYGNTALTSEINPELLKRERRVFLIRSLKRNFRMTAFVNLCLTPFKFIYMILYYLFHYGQIFRSSPSAMCNYQWSLYAIWKFREFNELPHTLDHRLKKSYIPAEKYITQFNFQYRITIAKFICFITGTLLTILTFFTLYEEQFLFNGVIIGDLSVVLMLGILGTVFKIAHSFIPSDNVVSDPAANMKDVVNYTHYFPEKWRGQVHHYEIREEFSSLFEFKLTFILNEILSVITAPYMLWFILAPKSDEIIDFLQNFIVRIQGVGYVCSFATFDFDKHGSQNYGNDSGLNQYLQSTNGKMEKSFLSFHQEYPKWKPSKRGTQFLQQTTASSIMPTDSIFDIEQKFGKTITASEFQPQNQSSLM